MFSNIDSFIKNWVLSSVTVSGKMRSASSEFVIAVCSKMLQQQVSEGRLARPAVFEPGRFKGQCWMGAKKYMLYFKDGLFNNPINRTQPLGGYRIEDHYAKDPIAHMFDFDTADHSLVQPKSNKVHAMDISNDEIIHTAYGFQFKDFAKARKLKIQQFILHGQV